MRKDAESHAAEDKKRRELAEQRNEIESRAFQIEKLLKEHEAKLSGADKQATEAAVARARETAKSDDIEKLKAANHELDQANQALSRALYQGGDGGAQAAGGPGGGNGAGGAKPDDVIDAEFEVKDS